MALFPFSEIRKFVRNSVPADWSFIEINEDLLSLEIFLKTPWPEFTAEAGLFVATPRRFDVGGLHVIHPDDACAHGFYNAESFEDIARPDCTGQPIGRVVGDLDGVGLVFKGDDGGDRTKDFFTSDTCGVIHLIEDGGFNVVAFAKSRGAAAADGGFGFLFANFEIRGNPVILLPADEWAHFRITVERRAQLDTLGLFGHGFDEF